ncbi:MAG: amidophosphoribosyltransferase [Pseudomonadota bacterium]
MTRSRTQKTADFLARERHARLAEEASIDAELQNLLNAHRLNEECGVFGIAGVGEAAAIAALGLHALQHRGQEAAGVATFDGELFYSERHPGLVSDAFSKATVLERLPGDRAIGHTRYSTQGGPVLRNTQPLYADLVSGGFAVAHNGNLTNARTLREELVKHGCIFQSTSDSELFLQLTARSHQLRLIDKLIDALKQIEGAYALVALTNKKLIGARDPVGIRPLILGDLDGAPVLASETCALDLIGAQFVRDIEPGEIVVCTEDGIESVRFAPTRPARPCVFELIYFARPDSIVDGQSVYELRKRLGRRLAKEQPADADVVIPVPDSGTPSALGYAQKAGLDFELGIVRSHYVGRTFITPQQKLREVGVKRKLSVNRSQIEGKRVVLVDDSLVRGTTSRKIVNMVRDAGAREVHMRIACPPIEFPDYYGIDTPSRDELLAATKSHEEMRAEIDADSLGFVSLDGLYKAMGRTHRDDDEPAFTDHCFTGDYPTQLTDLQRQSAKRSVAQLSLLAETG